MPEGIAAVFFQPLRDHRDPAAGGLSVEQGRVLIADDHPHFREGLRPLLLSAPDLEVVGEPGDGREAVSLAEKLQPDVILGAGNRDPT